MFSSSSFLNTRMYVAIRVASVLIIDKSADCFLNSLISHLLFTFFTFFFTPSPLQYFNYKCFLNNVEKCLFDNFI